MILENQKKQNAREQAYKDKFTRFDENMQRKLDWYQQHVQNPKAQ
jgi:hypothetical protein